MKKLGFILMLSCIALFSACSDKDDDKLEPGKKDYAKEIAGRYAGKDGLSVALPAVAGSPAETVVSDGAITIAKAGENKINIELKDFKFGTLSVGDIILNNVEVEGNDKEVIIKETVFKEYKLGFLPKLITITIKPGKVVGDKIDLALSITEVFDDAIGVTFKGTKNDKSGEAKLTKATTEDKRIVEITINEEKSEIVIAPALGVKVADLTEVVFNFEVSDKATTAPASGAKFDLTKEEDVTVKVTAEDGVLSKTYTLKLATAEFALFHDMESWVAENTGNDLFYAPIGGWTSSNQGVKSLKPSFTDRWNVTQVEDAAKGKTAAMLETLDTKGGRIALMFYSPKITSGSLYTGHFTLDMFNPLKSTKFGVPFNKKPKSLKGYYKYTPGAEYHYCPNPSKYQTTTVTNTIDEGSISAVLYDITDNESYLDGTNINDKENQSRIVASLYTVFTKQDAYKTFDLPFEFIEGRKYDASRKYRIAIVASSSKDGDKFSGAIGSKLWIDNIEIVAE